MSKKKNKYYKPDAQELSEAPKKFLYELNMFRAAVNANIGLPQSSKKIDRNILLNATLESVLLHARNLLDFFCREPWKDDIRAFHFLPKQDALWKSSKLAYLSSIRNDINKHLSHLTYKRVAKKAEWDLVRISKEIEEAFKEFLAILPEKERENWIIKTSTKEG